MKTISKNGLTIVFVSVITMVCYWAMFSKAGNLNPSAPPGPTMKTLDEIYDAIQVASSGIAEREGFCKSFSIGANTTVDIVQVPTGKRFVLLKFYTYNNQSLWKLKIGETLFIEGLTISVDGNGGYRTMHEFPDRCVTIDAEETLRFQNESGIVTNIQVFGYFFDI